MIVLTDEQAIVVHRLLTSLLLNEAYRISDVEDALSCARKPADSLSVRFALVAQFSPGDCATAATARLKVQRPDERR